MLMKQSHRLSFSPGYVLVFMQGMSKWSVNVTSTRKGSVLVSTSENINASFISFGKNEREGLEMHRSSFLKPNSKGSIFEFEISSEIIFLVQLQTQFGGPTIGAE